MPSKKSALTKILNLSLLILFVLGFQNVKANELDFSEMSKIPVLDEGRKKPLDTYARALLLQFSGKSRYEKMPAIEWLAKLLFDPESTQDDKVFMVNSMEVIQALGLDLETSRRFSYSQLEAGLGKLRELAVKASEIDEKQRSIVENGLLRLYHNINRYVNLAASYQFALPHSSFVIYNKELANYLGLEPSPVKHSYYTIFSKSSDLHKFLTAMQNNNNNASDVDSEVLRLSQELFQWSKFYRNMPITMIPFMNKEEEVWFSPWDVLTNVGIIKGLTDELDQLHALAQGYLNNNSENFTKAAASFRELSAARVSGQIDIGHSGLEVFYNKINFFLLSKVFYVLSLLTVLLSMVFMRKLFYPIAWVSLILALVPHTIGILTRMYIMNRPPVTNLYETFIFVSWIAVVVSVFVEFFQKRGVGLVTAAFSGISMLMIAAKYALDGDTMGMLVAVLDSNFWLATHVVTITMGYAGCVAAGIAGHIYLIQKAFNADNQRLKETIKAVYGIMAFGLIFSFIGTVLGGIWADQSWGRFWGWDPKENGALLIVLWCSILFHSRLGGIIRELGFAVGSVLGIIIVMFAWFGVNLLGVGLHSYGFSAGVFMKFFIYIASELVFLAICLFFINKKPSLKASA